MSFRNILVVPALLIFLAGCALQTGSSFDRPPASSELQRVLSGESLLPAGQAWQPPDMQPLLAINNDMRAFLANYVPRSKSAIKNLRNLLAALSSAPTMKFSYNPLKTYNAADTFHHQEGNCLSFTSMIISLARERGLRVSFNEVDIPATWDQLNESTFIYYLHINAIVRINRDKYIVDVNMANYNESYPQRKITDQLAEAHYYNNIAMNHYLAADIQAAFNHLRIAIELEPELAYLWGNLGTIYRRHGDYAEAEIAYKQALNLGSGTGAAASNLGHMYAQMGQQAKAEEYARLAEAYRLKNPYFRYHLAKKAYSEQRMGEALSQIQAAIKHYKKDHRFYILSAKINRALGNSRAEKSNLKKASSLTEGLEPSKLFKTGYEGLLEAY